MAQRCVCVCGCRTLKHSKIHSRKAKATLGTHNPCYNGFVLRATTAPQLISDTKPKTTAARVERVHPHLEAVKVWELKVKDTGAQVNVPGLLHDKVRERSRGMHNARIWRPNVVGWIFGWENKLLPLDGTHNGELSSLSAHT